MANFLSWRWAFASEPVLIVLLLFFASMVTDIAREQKAPFDSLGALLTFFGLALLVLGATLAGEFGWWSARRPFYVGDEVFAPFGLSAAVVFMLGGALVLLAYAAWAEWRARNDLEPLFQIRILRGRSFSVGAAVGFCFQLAVGALLFVLPVFLQSALFLDALDTGLVLLPYTLGIFVFALGASRLPARFSPVFVIRIGLILMLVGGWWVYQTASLRLELSSLVPALFFFGAGAGMVLARLTEVTLSEVKPSNLGAATGGDSTGKELGVAFGVAVLGSIFLALMFGRVVDGYFDFHGEAGVALAHRDKAVIELEDWAARVTDDQWKAFLDQLPDTTGHAYEAIVANAYLSAYQDTLQIILGVIIVMILVAFGFSTKTTASEEGGVSG